MKYLNLILAILLAITTPVFFVHNSGLQDTLWGIFGVILFFTMVYLAKKES